MASSVKSLLGNGVQELRFAFSQTGASSASLRAFVSRVHPEIKSSVPAFPILIRESVAAAPKMTARYDFGVERSVSTESLATAEEVEQAFVSLMQQAHTMPRSEESRGDAQIR